MTSTNDRKSQRPSLSRRRNGASLTLSGVVSERPRGLSPTELRRRIDAMIDLLQLQNNDVSFVLTNDETIHQLNKIYRRKDRPTDVLAFALREGRFAELAGGALGDVIVSVDTAKKQAAERGASLLEEVTMLLAHGLLHLVGWDHQTPAKDRRMRAETDRLCAAARAAGRSTGALNGRHRGRRGPTSKPGAKRPLTQKHDSRHTAKGRELRGKGTKKLEPSRPVKTRRSRKR